MSGIQRPLNWFVLFIMLLTLNNFKRSSSVNPPWQSKRRGLFLLDE